MFNIERILMVVAIASAISLPAISAVPANACSDKSAHLRAIHNVVRNPATIGGPDEAPKMFIPPPLDPDYHGSNGG